MILSLLVRREKLSVVGFRKPKSWASMIAYSFIAVIALQLFHLSVTMPILNRITGTTIDYSDFSNLMGNVNQLLFFLLLSWTLAAVGEEVAYRGYTQKILTDLFGKTTYGIVFVIGISSVLFGLAHLEQGPIGVIVTTIDAVVFSLLKYKFDNNVWAPIFAHGFYNSVGMITFFFAGPVYGFW